MLKQVQKKDTLTFWKDVDPDVVTDLSEYQKDAILDAVQRRGDGPHAADIRLSGFGFFLVVLFGRERRSADRLKRERRRRPVMTLNNLLLILVLWGSVIYTLYSLLPRAVELVLRILL